MTAAKALKKYNIDKATRFHVYEYLHSHIEQAMIEFAKLKVKEALEEKAEVAKHYGVNQETITNYDYSKIK